MTEDNAKKIALKALGWIAEQDDLAGVFMGSTGISVDEMRQLADQPDFLASVLDFILSDDQYVVGFCDNASLDYHDPGKARAVLSGGELPNWT